ncbi:hypothetical protein N665_0485s0018 [Sinapis alba]|nr:hypothetical protein N665_0485s0018 [Sinapis alba]
MIYNCRVSKEVWDFIPTDFKVSQEENEDLLAITNKMLANAETSKTEMLNMFLGWRLWKMRNNIVFQQKREHILQVVHKAIRDHQLWQKAMEQDKQELQPIRNKESQETSITQLIPQTAQYYCLVDASWKSQSEPSGIGWSLYSIQGTQLLQGSTSVQPTNSALEAEALAVRMAAQKLRALRFTNVAFFSDCKKVIDEIKQGMSYTTLKNICISEANTMIRDIKAMAEEQEFSFHYISRIWLCNVDTNSWSKECIKVGVYTML